MAAPHATCPSAEDLRAFGRGERMDPATADLVAQHLDGCEACADAVAGVSADGFLDRRRAAARPDGTPVPPGPLDGLARSITQPKSPPPDPGADALPTDVTAGTDYEIVRELGRGGMGVVYLARHRLTGRDEVLKVMGEGVTARPGAADRFRREIQSAARLDHRNIVRAYSAWQSGAQLVLAMEYVPGNDLAALVKARGPLPVLNACYYAHQVALGLQHAHEHGMVHRDIKPANLIFHRSGKRHTVKILDFGLAKVTSEAGPGAELTGSGQMMGTPLYMAPEQARDAAAADIRADIFSLGCTLYYLLTGTPPHVDGVLAVLAGERPKPLPAVRPEVLEELAAVVAKMMATAPDHRYQTPAEVAAALVPFLKPDRPQAAVPTAVPQTTAAGQQAAVAAPAPNPWGELTLSEPTAAPTLAPPPAPRRPRRAVWTAAAVALPVVLVLGAWAGGAFRATPPPDTGAKSGDVPRAVPRPAAKAPTAPPTRGAPPAVPALPPFAVIESRFDGGVTDGWTTINGKGRGDGAARMGPVAEGGIFFLRAQDRQNGETCFWRAPDKYRGDHSAAYGRVLRYELRPSKVDAIGRDTERGLVRLFGGGGVLQVRGASLLPRNANQWTTQTVRLDDSQPWFTHTGAPATEADIRRILGGVTDLWICAEYANGAEHCDLRSVAFGAD